MYVCMYVASLAGCGYTLPLTCNAGLATKIEIFFFCDCDNNSILHYCSRFREVLQWKFSYFWIARDLQNMLLNLLVFYLAILFSSPIIPKIIPSKLFLNTEYIQRSIAWRDRNSLNRSLNDFRIVWQSRWLLY